MLTEIDWLTEPFDQRLPVALGDVKVTLLPAQKDVGPLGVIVIGLPEEITIEIVELFAAQAPDKETA